MLKELEAIGLRGRGGAGFSMGKKASFLPHGDDREVPVLQRRRVRARHLQGPRADAPQPAPADRGLHDRRLRRRCTARRSSTSAASTTRRPTSSTPPSPRPTPRATSARASWASGFGCTLVVHRGAGAYICGEETALLDSLEGKRGNPRLKPPFPANQGLYQGPTLINNVETLSNTPHIVVNGADWFRKHGTERSPGTKVVSVSGNVQTPGNYEIELGIPAREIIYGLAGGPPDGQRVKAWFPGGSSAPVLTEADLDLPYDFENMAEAGSMLGSGRDHRRRRLGADRVGRAAAGRVLPPRVVRQVRSLPRGHQLDREDAGAHRPRRGDADGPRRDGERAGATSSATACACWATRWRCRSAR